MFDWGRVSIPTDRIEQDEVELILFDRSAPRNFRDLG